MLKLIVLARAQRKNGHLPEGEGYDVRISCGEAFGQQA